MEAKAMRGLIVSLALCCAVAALPAQAALRIEITEGAVGALPIAIVAFGVEPGLSAETDLAAVVAADLKSTGLFDPLPAAAMLETPASAPEVDYANWRQVKVENLVVGAIAADGSQNLRIRFDILGVHQQRSLASYQITARAGELRDAAHAVANLIYEHFTGEKGYFLSRIAYVTVQQQGGGPVYRLVVADYDGHQPQTVLTSRDPIMSPAWHPSGTKLAYVAFEVDRGRTSLRVQDLSTGEAREISSRPGINGAPAISPNGSKLAMVLSYQGNPDLYIYDLGTGELTQLTTNRAIDTQPAWSPNGRTIAFTSDRAGRPQIYRIPAAGGTAQRISFDGESNQDAEYAPDGDTMVMVQGGNGFRIAVLDLKTNNVRVVTNGPLDESPSFAPNGQSIIYASGGRGAALATVSTDGRVKARLGQEGGVRAPAWGPLVY